MEQYKIIVKMWLLQIVLIALILLPVHALGTIFPKFTKQPPKEELLHKRDTIVPCEAEGNNITYYWKRDGAEFDWTKLRTDANSGSITIDKPGQYQCFAKNENGIASSSTVTFLARGEGIWIPPPGLLLFSDTITRVKENQPAVLECQGDIPPFSRPSTIRWEHINAKGLGEPINDSRMTTGPDGHLYISNINQKDNSSQFKCESTPFEHDKRYLLALPFLHVVSNPVPPRKVPILQYAQQNVVAVASKSIEMFCIFGGTPEPTMKWRRNGTEINDNDRFKLGSNKRSLIIKNVTTDDEGPYECEASIDMNTVNYTISLMVNKAPQFMFKLNDTIGTVGEMLEFRCEVDGIPEPKKQWFYDGEPISSDNRSNVHLSVGGSSISIRNISWEDRGIYGCYANNSVDDIYQEFSSDVSYEVVETVTVKEGENVYVDCTAHDRVGKWFVGIELKQINENDNGTLIIENVQPRNANEYSCIIDVVSPRKGPTWITLKRATIVVEMPVGINTKHFVKKAVIGDSVEIECDLDATKNSTILLFKNDGELNLTKDSRMTINGPKLEIKSVEMSDAGDYKCKSYEKYLIRVDSVTKLVLGQGLQNPDGIKSEMNMDCSGFKISWDPVEGNDIVQYHVHWRPNSTNEFFNFTTSETSATISDQFHENYTFKVVAENERGKSKADADVHAFEMNCDLKAFPLSTTAFLLQWQKPNFEIKGYKVFYQEHSETDGLGTKKERQPPIDQTLITQTKLTGLKRNTTYRLFIHTVDKENEDQVFKVIESKTLSTEPAGTPDKPTLTWMQMSTPKENLHSNYVIRINWHPNVDGNPGTNFTAKYRKKGDKKWNYTKRIDDEDFVIVDGLSVGSIYELAVVSVGYEGEENKSDIAFGEIVDIDITRKKVDFELEGSEMELNCTIRHTNLKPLLDNPLVMVWESPNNNVARTDERIKQLDVIKENCDGERCDYIYRMMVSKLDKNKDSGDYRCYLTFDGTWILDSATIKVDKILDICSTFVNIKPVSTVNLTTNANETAKWTAELIGYPNPSFDWRSNNGDKIPWGSESSNKSVSFTSTENGKIITLTLSNVTVRDSGIYTLYAENGNGEHNQIKSDFRLNVRGKPELDMINKIVVKVGERARATCNIFAYPKASVEWSFESDSTSGNSHAKSLTDFNTTETEYNQATTASIDARENGKMICRANNEHGSSETVAQLFINDLDEEFEIRSDNKTIVINYRSVIECGAASFKYREVNWYKNGDLIDPINTPGVEVKSNDTSFSIRKAMHWDSITKASAGNYTCRAKNKETGKSETKNFTLDAVEPEEPRITESNFENGAIMRVELTGAVNLTCEFSGVPPPKLNWYKYEDEVKKAVEFNNHDHMCLANDGKMLRIKFTKDEDQCTYECEAKYGQASDQRLVTIKINVPWYKSTYFTIGLVILIIILVVCLILCAWAVYRHRKKLKRAGLSNFMDGHIDDYNPELALDAQADLLPYDKKYEFPRDKLKFGRELGAGAFGVVKEATAQGIIPGEEETKVAVKMVKNNASNEVMRALVSELKIMVHLGQHLNVVNLLGAVTKDITKFNLMVIVEYCPFGSLHSVLVKNRRYFVDQIVPGKDEINTKIASMDTPTNSKPSSSDSKKVNNVDCHFLNSLASVYRSKAHNYTSFDVYGGHSMEPMLQSQGTTSRSNSGCVVRVDESTDESTRSVTTTDLLVWSFQIARGMDYLASRKVLHGDLAARNILLCEGNVVKICDFGLARSLCKNENYHMKTKRGLPLKWLALESINDLVFSTHSDVWSFGISMWELFSLGATPYLGMEPDELKRKLNDGYRLEKAEFATQALHDIMLSCWRLKPDTRPTFSDLEQSISKILGKAESDHYVDLNEPYVEANESRFNSGDTDYLAMLGSPNCQAPSVPVNVLREKYFPFLAKSPDDTLTATNGLYVESDTPKSSKKNHNNSEASIPLRSFKPIN